MIKNNTQPTERQAIEIDKKNFNSYLVEDLQKKNKNYICFSSKTDLIKFKSILKCDKQLGLKDFDKKALYYYGKGDDKVFETLKNIQLYIGDKKFASKHFSKPNRIHSD